MIFLFLSSVTSVSSVVKRAQARAITSISTATSRGRRATSTVEVARLPKDVAVEIDVIALA